MDSPAGFPQLPPEGSPSLRRQKPDARNQTFGPSSHRHLLPLVAFWRPRNTGGETPDRHPGPTGSGGRKMSLWLPPWVCAGCSTSPAWPRSPGEDRVATWETAPTGVERELKSTSWLRLACGRRQSGGMVQPGVSRGWDLRGPPPFFAGADACLNSRLALAPR